MKKFLVIVLGLGILYFCLRWYVNTVTDNRLLTAELAETQTELEQTASELAEKKAAMTEVELQQSILKKARQKAVCFNEEIQSEVELTVFSVEGEYCLKHDRTQDAEFLEWLVGSEANVLLSFRAGISIPTKFIWAQIDDDGNFVVLYDVEKLKIAYIEITDLVATQKHGIWGVAYSAEEISALTMIGKDDIETSIKDRTDYFEVAEQQLIAELQRIAKQFFEVDVTVARYSMKQK